MKKNIENRLNTLKELKKDLEVEKKILNKIEISNNLKDLVTLEEKEVKELECEDVSVRLGDLVKELSKLSYVKLSNINISIESSSMYHGNIEQSKIIDGINEYGCYTLKISGYLDSKYFFNYIHLSPIEFDLVEADDKTLMEHAVINTTKNTVSDRSIYETKVSFKDIDDIIWHFKLKDFDRKESSNWYPVFLIRDALINCVNRYDNGNQEYCKVYSNR